MDELLALISDVDPLDLALEEWLSPVDQDPGHTQQLPVTSAGDDVASESLPSLRFELSAREGASVGEQRVRGVSARVDSQHPYVSRVPDHLITQFDRPKRRTCKQEIATLHGQVA